MKVLSPPRGLIVDLITPLKDKGEIDERGLGKHVERVIPHAQALFLSSPILGEGKRLETWQREDLFEKALVAVRARCPIMIWISHETEEKTRGFLRRLEGLLEEGKYTGPVFWVDTPLYYHSNRALSNYYSNMSIETRRTLLLLNDPELVRNLSHPLKRANIRTMILKDLSRIHGIRGLIFYGSFERARNYEKAVRANPDFMIFDGDEAHFLSHPSLSGVVSMGANLVPSAWRKITASSIHGSDEKKAYPDYLRQIWGLGLYLMELRSLYLLQREAVFHIKRVLWEMGVIENPVCTAQPKKPGEGFAQLMALMKEHGDWG